MLAAAQSRFADPWSVAYAAMASLGAGAVLDLQRVLYALSDEAVSGAIRLPSPTLHLFVRLVTIALFIAWVDRVWGNLTSFGRRPEQSRVGAVICFLVPPLCFYRPVQIVNQVWSDLESSLRPDHRRHEWFPRLAVGWWASFLIPPAILIVAVGRRDLAQSTRLSIVATSEFINVVAALLGITVIYLVSQRQHDAHGARAAVATPPVPAAPPQPANELVQADPTSLPSPVPIAPAIPPGSSRPLPRTASAHPVQRVIRGQQTRRRSLEQALDTIPPRVWQRLLVGAGGVAAVALLLSGALLIQHPKNLAAALIQIGFASLLFGAVFAVAGQEEPLPGRGRRWAVLAVSVVALAAIQLLAIAEGLLR